MARTKKIQKYVPNTKVPANGREWTLLERTGKYEDWDTLYAMYKQKAAMTANNRSYSYDYYSNWDTSFKKGEHDVTKWKDSVGKYVIHGLYQHIWPLTPEYKALNDAFMAEYDSREDLQEIYRESYSSVYYLYDEYGQHHDKTESCMIGTDMRPLNYMMFNHVIRHNNDGLRKIELSRETPYQEGDLVLLREPYVGRRGVDPFYKNEWNPVTCDYERSPGPDMPRIGTVIAVTDKVERNWRPSKGSKIIQLVWMGSEDMVDVEEKYIKWHERPTYKNGMKKRPENRE